MSLLHCKPTSRPHTACWSMLNADKERGTKLGRSHPTLQPSSMKLHGTVANGSAMARAQEDGSLEKIESSGLNLWQCLIRAVCFELPGRSLPRA